jgi:hypothetical protein
MKKISLILIAILPFAFIQANAYSLPPTEIKIPALRSQYLNVEQYLKKNFDSKINAFSAVNKVLFDDKIRVIQDIFRRIDDLALNKKKEEVI